MIGLFTGRGIVNWVNQNGNEFVPKGWITSRDRSMRAHIQDGMLSNKKGPALISHFPNYTMLQFWVDGQRKSGIFRLEYPTGTGGVDSAKLRASGPLSTDNQITVLRDGWYIESTLPNATGYKSSIHISHIRGVWNFNFDVLVRSKGNLFQHSEQRRLRYDDKTFKGVVLPKNVRRLLNKGTAFDKQVRIEADKYMDTVIGLRDDYISYHKLASEDNRAQPYTPTPIRWRQWCKV